MFKNNFFLPHIPLNYRKKIQPNLHQAKLNLL